MRHADTLRPNLAKLAEPKLIARSQSSLFLCKGIGRARSPLTLRLNILPTVPYLNHRHLPRGLLVEVIPLLPFPVTNRNCLTPILELASEKIAREDAVSCAAVVHCGEGPVLHGPAEGSPNASRKDRSVRYSLRRVRRFRKG